MKILRQSNWYRWSISKQDHCQKWVARKWSGCRYLSVAVELSANIISWPISSSWDPSQHPKFALKSWIFQLCSSLANSHLQPERSASAGWGSSPIFHFGTSLWGSQGWDCLCNLIREVILRTFCLSVSFWSSLCTYVPNLTSTFPTEFLCLLPTRSKMRCSCPFSSQCCHHFSHSDSGLFAIVTRTSLNTNSKIAQFSLCQGLYRLLLLVFASQDQVCWRGTMRVARKHTGCWRLSGLIWVWGLLGETRCLDIYLVTTGLSIVHLLPSFPWKRISFLSFQG